MHSTMPAIPSHGSEQWQHKNAYDGNQHQQAAKIQDTALKSVK